MVSKEQLKTYLEDKRDISLGQICKDLGISIEELDSIEVHLRELVQEGWLRKEFCREHNVFEFNPGTGRLGVEGEL